MTKNKKYNKRKKYTSRIERNNKIYYNRKTEENNSKLLIKILIISIILNGIFILKIEALNKVNETTKHQKQNYKEQIEQLKEEYTNYLFLGDSITEIYDLDKYFKDLPIVNSGISGNTTEDILNNMKNRVYNYNSSKVFLLIGTNDLARDKSVDEIVLNIEKIINKIKKNQPQAEIYIESIYPVNKNLDKKMVANRKNEDIININEQLKKYCNDNNYTYINMFKILVDKEDNLNKNYTYDGLHPNEKGYEVITKELKKYLD